MMIKQEKDYIKRQKKKYLIASSFWSAIVLIIFVTGLILTKTRANLFTVFACVMAIVASLFITRCISFSRFNDCDEERASMLEAMNGTYDLYHSAIIPYASGSAYFEHVVVTELGIYFIAYTKAQVDKYRTWMQELLGTKGIGSSHLYFLVAKDAVQLRHHISHIEKEEKLVSKDRFEDYSNKVNEILM